MSKKKDKVKREKPKEKMKKTFEDSDPLWGDPNEEPFDESYDWQYD